MTQQHCVVLFEGPDYVGGVAIPDMEYALRLKELMWNFIVEMSRDAHVYCLPHELDDILAEELVQVPEEMAPCIPNYREQRVYAGLSAGCVGVRDCAELHRELEAFLRHGAALSATSEEKMGTLYAEIARQE